MARAPRATSTTITTAGDEMAWVLILLETLSTPEELHESDVPWPDEPFTPMKSPTRPDATKEEKEELQRSLKVEKQIVRDLHQF